MEAEARGNLTLPCVSGVQAPCVGLTDTHVCKRISVYSQYLQKRGAHGYRQREKERGQDERDEPSARVDLSVLTDPTCPVTRACWVEASLRAQHEAAREV